tara:strand:- start:2189 stop:2755 length:567 start_codon:yes stop_codon:yes gene_type:complete
MYYLKIINITPPTEVDPKSELYVNIKYNSKERISKSKWDGEDWNQIFLFEEQPKKISIFLMNKDEIIEGGELPINQNDLLELTIYCIEIQHGFVGVKPIKEIKSEEKDKEIDQNEIYYLKSVIDDKDNLIEETDASLSLLKDKYEEINDELNNLKEKIDGINEKNRERDDLIIELADKFCRIKDILKD